MINGVNNVGAGATRRIATPASASSAPVSGKNFSQMLARRMEEISRLQQTAPPGVTKDEAAFQTLLSIQSKLLEAYKEICAIGV